MKKEDNLKDLIEANDLPIINGFDGTNGKETGNKWMLCIHMKSRCKYQGFVGDGAFIICNNYPKCLEEGCELEKNQE